MTHASSSGRLDSGRGRGPASALLGFCALALGLLPLAVAWWRLLPAFDVQARFLLFYAPLVALLSLGYLYYVRDIVARVLFADFVESVESLGEVPHAGPGIGRRIGSVLLTLLPLALLAASLYCLTRYVSRFRESLELAGAVTLAELEPGLTHDSAGAATALARADTAARANPRDGGPDSVSAYLAPADSLDAVAEASAREEKLAYLRGLPELAGEADPLRAYTLRRATIEDIPYFFELTAMYLGTIVCGLAAVFLILLKEYARRVMDLSEQEVVWRGRVGPAP